MSNWTAMRIHLATCQSQITTTRLGVSKSMPGYVIKIVIHKHTSHDCTMPCQRNLCFAWKSKFVIGWLKLQNTFCTLWLPWNGESFPAFIVGKAMWHTDTSVRDQVCGPDLNCPFSYRVTTATHAPHMRFDYAPCSHSQSTTLTAFINLCGKDWSQPSYIFQS